MGTLVVSVVLSLGLIERPRKEGQLTPRGTGRGLVVGTVGEWTKRRRIQFIDKDTKYLHLNIAYVENTHRPKETKCNVKTLNRCKTTHRLQVIKSNYINRYESSYFRDCWYYEIHLTYPNKV